MDPIIVMGGPRTGSSMTAGIFVQHGIWVGKCKAPHKNNEKGFFENLELTRFLRGIFGAPMWQPAMPISIRPHFERIMQGQGWSGERWLWKGSAMFYPTFHEWDCKFITCRRDTKSIFDSMRGSPNIFGKNLSDDELLSFIDNHQAMMDQIPGAAVDTRAVAGGNYDSIVKALEFAGIEPQMDVIDDFVEPSLWHYSS